MSEPSEHFKTCKSLMSFLEDEIEKMNKHGHINDWKIFLVVGELKDKITALEAAVKEHLGMKIT